MLSREEIIKLENDQMLEGIDMLLGKKPYNNSMKIEDDNAFNEQLLKMSEDDTIPIQKQPNNNES